MAEGEGAVALNETNPNEWESIYFPPFFPPIWSRLNRPQKLFKPSLRDEYSWVSDALRSPLNRFLHSVFN